MEQRFDDAVAVVTGGSTGIGLATVERLAEEGCRVATCARDIETLRTAVGDIDGEVFAVEADVTDGDDVDRLVERTVAEFGGLDVVVNNAGVSPEPQSFESIPADDWHEVYEVNVLGPVRTIRAALPHLADGGRVVNVASEVAVQPDGSTPHYAASKAALVSLTKSLSKALGEANVRVNAVSPAVTRSERIERAFADTATEQGVRVEQAERAFLEAERPDVELGRLANPEEVAAVVTFLASAESSYVTGANYRVDGGSVGSIDI